MSERTVGNKNNAILGRCLGLVSGQLWARRGAQGAARVKLSAGAKAVLDGRSAWHVEQGEALAVLRALPDASVDGIITDPPYSSGGLFRGDRARVPSEKYVQTGTKLTRPEFGGDNRDQRSFAYWCLLWLTECQRIARAGAPLCVFSDWRQLPTVTDVVQAAGWVWRGIAVWDKTEGTRPAMGRFRAQAEYVAWGTNGPTARAVDKEVGVLAGVVRECVKQADKHHMTGKPTNVMRHLSRIVRGGGLILDPFAGSCSTAVGALLEGRRCLSIEREASYAEIGRKRLASLRAEPDAA